MRSGRAAVVRLLAVLLAGTAAACAHAVPVTAPEEPIARDRSAPPESIVVVLPDRCSGEPATHLFRGSISALDAALDVAQRPDSAYLLGVLTRLTELITLPVSAMHDGVLAEIVLTIGRDGAVRHYEARSLRQAVALGRSIAGSLDLLHFPGALDSLGVPGDSVTLFVSYETGAGAPFGYARPFRAAPPTARAALVPGTGVPPRYPTALWESGVEGEAVLHFVVDTAGQVDRTRVIVRATDEDFAKTTLDAFARYDFTPTRVGACALPTLFEMPFEFRVRD